MGAEQVNGSELSLTPLVAWVGAFALILSFGTNIWNIIGSSARKNGARIEEMGKRLDQTDNRLNSLEHTLRGMPGKDDIHGVQVALSEMRGDLRVMQASMIGNTEIMKRLETIVTRHEDHLLDGAKR
jgi:hypothetical protein